MNLILELLGYTNCNVVRCMYDRSPLEFFASVKNGDILDQQIDILRGAWPHITKKIFLEDVCSSTLDKRIWLNRRELILKCNLKLFLQNIDIQDINNVLEYSMLNKPFTDLFEAERFFKDISYPTIKIDFFPLIKKKCDPYAAGLQDNMLYYLSKPPVFDYR